MSKVCDPIRRTQAPKGPGRNSSLKKNIDENKILIKMQNIKNRKQTMPSFCFVPFLRYNLTELKNIDEIVSPSGRRVNDNNKKLILRYLANKIGTNIVINRARMRPNKCRIFIVGIYSSAFLQKLVIKFLNTYSHKLILNK